MYKLKALVFTFLLGLCIFVSCTDEDEVRRNVTEGIPVTLRLPFAPDGPVKIETRAGENVTYVDNLYILIFDKDGKRLSGDSGGGLVSLAPNSTNINLTTSSGLRYIYGVANLSTSTLEVDEVTLDNITNVDQLKTLSLTLNQPEINESTGKFLMSGFCAAPNDNSLESPSLCELSVNKNAESDNIKIEGTDETPVLKLQRLQSKIKFNVKTGHNVTSFVVTSFSVKNIPASTPLYEDKTKTTTSADKWFDSEENKTMDAGSKGFTFYMLENKQQKKSKEFPKGSNDENYKYRSDAEYAPGKGTYVVLKGAYEGPGNKYEKEDQYESQPVQASVVYYIYLGYVDDNLDDFNSLRNKDYTYNVTVNGVNSIIVEAEFEKEDPSAGGDVYYETGGEILKVDAHYASKVMKFTKANLAKDNAADNIKILVSSWKTAGFEDADKEWLTFIEGGYTDKRGNEYPVRYPGSEKVMSADKFIDRLKNIAKDNEVGDDEEFYFTCFINENYPIKDVDNENDWTSFVNRPTERMAQIICRAKKGYDSQTIDAAYLIRQKPIYTFFKDGDQPWGIESINETTEYQNGIEIGLRYGFPSASGTDNNDGRANMIAELGSVSDWYKDGYAPVNASEPEYKDYPDAFQCVYAACMQRNRDENGDGKISEDEIKWYLPAIYQYTDMSIGANALPKTIQLYSDDDYAASGTVNTSKTKRWRFKHYVSNSNQQIYWAEEGGPYGEYKSDNGWNSAWKQTSENPTYHIRCIRNLGSNSLKKNTPSKVATKNGNVMDLSIMSADALRSNKISGELDVHSERDIASLPYVGSFKVATNLCSKATGYKYDDKSGSYALSDRNGYYYVRSENDKVSYISGNKNAKAYLNENTGPYIRKGEHMAWVGARKGNAMYSDINGYYWNTKKPLNPQGTWEQTSPHTYVYVGEGKGIYKPNGTTTEFNWSEVNIAADKTGKSPCSYYSEESDGSDVGTWRLPNMRELLLMVSHGGYTTDELISRTYYSFYLNDILVNGKKQNDDGTLNGYTIYSPMDGESREGFSYNNSVVYLIDPGNPTVKIRCVKDN